MSGLESVRRREIDRPVSHSSRRRILFVVSLGLAYVAAFVASGGLVLGPTKDEVHFWPVVVRFSETLPRVSLSDYRALMTPFVFIWYAGVERVGHGGILVARLINLTVSFAIACAVGMPRSLSVRSALATLGLLCFPYFLGTSVYMYTDIFAAAFVLGGVESYRRDRHALSGLSFVLAIACRQYMVAFPAALTLWECVRGGARARVVLIQSVAAGTLFIWWWIFGGFVPPTGQAVWDPRTTASSVIRPENALYFLACVGIYFVVVEAMLIHRCRVDHLLSRLRSPLAVGGTLLVLVLFVVFPPWANVQVRAMATMGFLDKGAHLVLPDVARIVFFAFLACLAVVRFATVSLETMLLLSNAFLMTKAHIGWDKYALPLLVVLWFAVARGDADEQRTPS